MIEMFWEFRFHLALFFCTLFFSFESAFAQKSWDEILKGSNGLVIEQKKYVDIAINERGALEIVSRIYEETQHFGEITNLYREQSIGYSSTFTEIKDLEAYSLIPSGKNKFKKIPVKDFTISDSRSSGIFYDDQKKISYVFPGLIADSKTVISYTKKYLEPRLWGYFMFSSFFPVERSEFVVKAPAEVKLNFHKHGIEDHQLKFSKEEKGKYTVYSWKADHVENIKLSKGMDGVLHTAPHLIIHVKSYEFEGKTHNVLGDVKDLHAWYRNFLDDIEDEQSDEINKMVGSIIEGKSTELEKVEAIYDWVQQNIKYIAIEDGLGGFRPRTPNTVFNRRYGDCKDMSTLIHKMLKLANIPSNLAWIGTKSIPYSHREVPTPMADNHMICTYINDNQYYFLDATDQYNTLGIPSSHIQGREALVNKGANDFELVEVPIMPSEKNYRLDSVYCKIDNGVILGTGKIKFAGYNKIPVTNSLENLDGEDKRTYLNMILKKGNNKFSLNSVTTHYVGEKNKDLWIDYNFLLEDYVLLSDNEIFINPHLSKDPEHDIIDINTTTEDIYYSYKNMTSNLFNIDIPDGYEVSYLPEDIQYDNGDFGFDIQYEAGDSNILIHQKIEINTLQLRTEQFDEWNKMMKMLFSAYKESIVLSKI